MQRAQERRKSHLESSSNTMWKQIDNSSLLKSNILKSFREREFAFSLSVCEINDDLLLLEDCEWIKCVFVRGLDCDLLIFEGDFVNATVVSEGLKLDGHCFVFL